MPIAPSSLGRTASACAQEALHQLQPSVEPDADGDAVHMPNLTLTPTPDLRCEHGRFGTEVATGQPSVIIAKDINTRQITQLKAAIAKASPQEKPILEAKLAKREQIYEAGIHSNKTWISSLDCRESLAKAGSLTSYQRTYVPGLVNQHIHRVEVPGQKDLVIGRCGGMQDESFGLLSRTLLQGMQGFSSDKTGKDLVRDAKQFLQDKAGPHLESNLQQLDYLSNCLKGKLNPTQNQMLTQNLAALAKPDKALAALSCSLNDQALAMLLDAMATNPDGVDKACQSGQFVFCRQLLLNHTTRSFDTSGRVNCEGNKMENERATFEALYNKELVYDPTGPFIDEQGRIHLNDKRLEGKTVRFCPLLACTSIQGHLKNDGPQKVINDAFFAKAKALGLSCFNEIEEKVSRKRQTSAKTAVSLGSAVIQQGISLSTGCASAKDRTGLICALIVYYHMAKHAGALSPADKIQLKIIEGKILSGGLADAIIQKNQRTPGIKIYDPRSLYYLSGVEIARHLSRTCLGKTSMNSTS